MVFIWCFNYFNLDDDQLKPCKETIMEILKKERLKDLPLDVLGQLVEACCKTIVEKTNKS